MSSSPGGERRGEPNERSNDGRHVSGGVSGIPGRAQGLLEREIELRRSMEALAAARRELPPGGMVPRDYIFQGIGVNGTPTDVRLSELFASGRDSLAIYGFMFPGDPSDERPGPAGATSLACVGAP